MKKILFLSAFLIIFSLCPKVVFGNDPDPKDIQPPKTIEDQSILESSKIRDNNFVCPDPKETLPPRIFLTAINMRLC